jgi:hypothetical protein
MSIVKYKLQYTNLLLLTSGIIFFGMISRSIAKAPAALAEYLLIFSLLFFAIIYTAQSLREQNDRSLIVYIFLIYLMFHSLGSMIYRPFIIDATLYEVFFFTLSEFRVSTLGYFLPLVFLPLALKQNEKVKKFLIVLLKISIVYTFVEQILSLMGLRTLFEEFYDSAGVVSDNLVGRKSFGMYRVWGFTGSPQLLGVFHLYALIIMYINKDKLWVIFSIIAVIASTSKTAYLILVILGILYLLKNKNYLILIFATLIFFGTAFQINEFYNYLRHEQLEDYRAFQSIIQSIKGYFILSNNVIINDTHELIRNGKVITRDFSFFVEAGPWVTFSEYFYNNPIEIIFGKGIMYSFMPKNLLPLEFIPYMATGSDFYIIIFMEQYGLVGLMFLLLMFVFYPLYAFFKNDNYHSLVLIIFFLATLHYPPNVPKMMMLIVGYSIYNLYFIKERTQHE